MLSTWRALPSSSPPTMHATSPASASRSMAGLPPRAERKARPVEADEAMATERDVTAGPCVPILEKVEAAIGGLVELVAGTLVAVETAILFAGVVSRYALRQPLTWSDELA